MSEDVNVRLDSHPQDDRESNEGNVVSRIDTNTREMTRANAKCQRCSHGDFFFSQENTKSDPVPRLCGRDV